MNNNLFGMFIKKPLQLFFCLVVVEALIFKLNLKAAILRLEGFYLRFRLRQTVKSKRKTFADYIRNRQIFEGVSGSVNEAHSLNSNLILGEGKGNEKTVLSTNRISTGRSIFPPSFPLFRLCVFMSLW